MSKKSNREKGQAFEDLVQKCINSGAFEIDKGDLRGKDLLIEVKYTDKKSYRLTQKVLEKIWNEALDRNKLPRIVIGIPRKNERELFIINGYIHIERKPKL